MNKQLFKERQKELLWLANTEAGRYLLGIKEKEPVIKVTPNSVHLKLEPNLFVAKIWTYERVAKEFLPFLSYQEILEKDLNLRLENEIEKYKAFLHFENLERNYKYPTIFLKTDSYYSTSEDGYTVNAAPGGWETWTEARGVQGDEQVDKTETEYKAYFQRYGAKYMLHRGWFRIDYSSLSTDADISSATYKFYGRFYNSSDSTSGIVLAKGNQGATLEAADHNSYGAEYGRLDSGLSGSDAWASVSLNSTGIADINKGGHSEYAVLNIRDFNNNEPSTDGYWGVAGVDTSEVTSEHYVEVTYPLPSGAIFAGSNF